MIFTKDIITFTVGMIAILNPIGNTAIYIGMTANMKRKTQQKRKTKTKNKRNDATTKGHDVA